MATAPSRSFSRASKSTFAPRGGGTTGGARTGNGRPGGNKPRPEPKIIHQAFFKSVGPRTYAAQVKEISNGNHLLVLTEGKRDEGTNEVRKTRLFVYAEDFPALFEMLDKTRSFIDAHPVSADAQAKRDRFWARQRQTSDANSKAPPPAAATEPEPADELDP